MWITTKQQIINMILMVMLSKTPIPTYGIRCEEAHLKCAFRKGCGMALRNYMIGCSGVLQGGTFPERCPDVCLNSLIALVSTREGEMLMECECKSTHCEDQKNRANVCRSQVVRLLNERVVPCEMAHSICNADAGCNTAFEYYEKNCKSMFHGVKCTPKCRNSLNILRRQEKAAKLKHCKCEGPDKNSCATILNNTRHLCMQKQPKHHYNQTRNGTKCKISTTGYKPVLISSSANYVNYETFRTVFILIMMVLIFRGSF